MYRGLRWTRRIFGGLGLAALILSAFAGENAAGNSLALVGFLALAAACLAGWLEIPAELQSPQGDPSAPPTSGKDWLVLGLVAALSAIIIQSWFHWGSVIATGDVAPAAGTAWISRLFSPITWTESILGGPSFSEGQLPWATVLGVVHFFSGSPELAQRIWYTLLFSGAAVAAFSLMRLMGLGIVPGLVGSAAYVLSPYVVSNVDYNPTYLAALGLLVALPTLIFAAARGRLRVLAASALIGLAAPLVGYVYQNPPLVGMILALFIASPFLVRLMYGRELGRRAFRTTFLGLVFLAALSAYWLVPAAIHTRFVSSGQLAPIASWSWTEIRATVRNAFWLNGTWGWPYPEYYPFSWRYDTLPLSVVKFGLPIFAFSALLLADATTHVRPRWSLSRLGLVVTASLVSLGVILVSTGTNQPGATVFTFLYQLPFGWLLREPVRFLMIVGVTYALLVAISVESVLATAPALGRQVAGWASRLPASGRRVAGMASGLPATFVLLVIAAIALTGFPVITGEIVPDNRPLLPSAHVHVPNYWPKMAQYIDDIKVAGPVLILPPDDFYQMPYSWGYYGNDAFISDLMARPAIVPNPQGYTRASDQLLSAIDLIATSTLNRQWTEAERVLAAVGTRLILVRGDIQPSFGSRGIMPPAALSESLSQAPNFRLIRQIGPLQLFEFDGVTQEEAQLAPAYVTTNTSTPDLRLLSLIPPGASLVSAPSDAETSSAAVQAPPIGDWGISGDALTWDIPIHKGLSYTLAALDSTVVTQSGIAQTDAPVAPAPSPNQLLSHTVNGTDLRVALNGEPALQVGASSTDAWIPGRECSYVLASVGVPFTAERLPSGGPGGLSALEISSRAGGACESQQLRWTAGPIVLSLLTQHTAGAPPQVCLWEFGPQRCASIPPMRSGASWTRYQTAIRPDPGTTALSLLLINGPSSSQSVNAFADLHVLRLPSLPTIVLIGLQDPATSSPNELLLTHTNFSSDWQGPASARHVLVDGMLNGWLVPTSASSLGVRYGPDGLVRGALIASAIGYFLVAVLFVWLIAGAKLRSRVGWKRRDTKAQ
jgi:arabinofuranan 3-O-arabinosyltransferase